VGTITADQASGGGRDHAGRHLATGHRADAPASASVIAASNRAIVSSRWLLVCSFRHSSSSRTWSLDCQPDARRTTTVQWPGSRRFRRFAAMRHGCRPCWSLEAPCARSHPRRHILAPAFCSIEEYLGKNQQACYDVLRQVGDGGWHPERDARPWVRFCLTAHYHQATHLVQWSRIDQRLWDHLEIELNQRGLPERMLLALGDAAIGYKVRNALYRKAADLSELTASRDLKSMVDARLLVPRGEKRGRVYTAAPLVARIFRAAWQEPTNVDPFTLTARALPGLAPR